MEDVAFAEGDQRCGGSASAMTARGSGRPGEAAMGWVLEAKREEKGCYSRRSVMTRNTPRWPADEGVLLKKKGRGFGTANVVHACVRLAWPYLPI